MKNIIGTSNENTKMNKLYEVKLAQERVYYITIVVEAESEEEAKDKVKDDTEHALYIIKDMEDGGVIKERIYRIEEVEGIK